MKSVGFARLSATCALGGAALTGCMSATDAGPAGEERPPLATPVCPTETRGWSAWVNAMPGPGARPTLIVQGEALLPDRASVTLRAGATDRMQPPGQRMTLSVEPSNEAAGWQVARAEITPALPQYREIIVTCDGAEVARLTDIQTVQ